MKRLLRHTLAFMAILSITTKASAFEIDNPFSEARLEIGYSAGQFIGIKNNYAELGIFLPAILTQKWTLFADARVYNFSRSTWGYSAGIGARMGYTSGILGANIYIDSREGNHHGVFHRLGLGIEWLGSDWDIRINGYLPCDFEHNSKKVVFNDYIGDFFATCKTREFSLGKGIDAEIGRSLYSLCDFDVYGAAGPYYYYSKRRNNIVGGYARLEIDWKTYIFLQVRASYDPRFHFNAQGQILLSLPFELFFDWQNFDVNWNRIRNEEDICRYSFVQPVRRNGIIFTEHCCSYNWNW